MEFKINKEEIFANMIHEIRTPLAVISTYAQLAVEELKRGIISAQTISDLETVSADARRLSNMASSTLDILTSSTDPAANEELDLEPIDVRTVIERVISLLRHGKAAEHFEMTLRWDEPKSAACIVMGDEGLLMRLFWNILSNAVTHSGGSKIAVAVSADTREETTRITVTDNGQGVPAGLRDHLFTRGVSGSGGSGLGLSLCREITRLLQGEISLDTNTDTGAAFIILLPSAPCDDI